MKKSSVISKSCDNLNQMKRSTSTRSLNDPSMTLKPQKSEVDYDLLLDLEYDKYLQILAIEGIFKASNQEFLKNIDDQAIQILKLYDELLDKKHTLDMENIELKNDLSTREIIASCSNIIDKSKLLIDEKNMDLLNNIIEKYKSIVDVVEMQNIKYDNKAETNEKLIEILRKISESSEKIKIFFEKSKINELNNLTEECYQKAIKINSQYEEISHVSKKLQQLLMITTCNSLSSIKKHDTEFD